MTYSFSFSVAFDTQIKNEPDFVDSAKLISLVSLPAFRISESGILSLFLTYSTPSALSAAQTNKAVTAPSASSLKGLHFNNISLGHTFTIFLSNLFDKNFTFLPCDFKLSSIVFCNLSRSTLGDTIYSSI